MEIRSERLLVEVAEPGSMYRGSRFDWTSFVARVVLDDRHSFCTVERLGAAEDVGVGLCCEFGMRSAVGYDDAKPGESFIKPGVGLLTRADTQAYSFGRPYPIAQPFPTRCVPDTESQGVRLVSEPVACRGYALRLERALRVVENRLVVQSRLENVGERPFTVDEYCHNFVAPGGRQTQKGLRLVFPFEPVLEGAKALLPFEVAGRELQFDGAVSRGRGFHTHVSNGCSNPSGTSRFNGARWWELISADGARMRETVSEPWKRFAFWGAPHVVSPEVFVEFDLNAGMQVQWTRTFEFSV